VLGTANNTIGGSWTNSFAAGNQTLQSGFGGIGDGYLLLSSAQTVTTGKYGATSAKYSAYIGCYGHL
jgi:hypothetical protein